MAASSEQAAERRAPGGFSLLEMMIALAIVSTVLAATYYLQHQGFRVYERSEQLTDAVLLAREKLAESQFDGADAGRGSREGSRGETLFWRVEFGPAGRAGVREVRVQILPAADAPPLLEVVTYVPLPKTDARP